MRTWAAVFEEDLLAHEAFRGRDRRVGCLDSGRGPRDGLGGIVPVRLVSIQPDGDRRAEPTGVHVDADSNPGARSDGDGCARSDGDGCARPDGDGCARSDGDRCARPDGDRCARSDGDRRAEAVGDGYGQPDGPHSGARSVYVVIALR
jgi:hypothetical protein